MKQLTIKEIKDGYEDERYSGLSLKETLDGRIPPYRIYVIKGDGCILYVGKSQDAIVRMESHVGKGMWVGFFGSHLDYLLITKQANDYTVDFYDEDEVRVLYRYNPLFTSMDRMVGSVEEQMIFDLAPVFNIINNNSGKRENKDRWYEMHPDPDIDFSDSLLSFVDSIL